MQTRQAATSPDAATINIQEFFNNHPFSRFQWVVFALCFSILLLDGFDTAAIGFIAPSLMVEWGIAKPDLAPVLISALIGIALGSFAAGPISSKLGRKLALIVAVFIFGVACAFSYFAGSLNELVVMRFITGLGLGAAMPNAVTMMSEFCPDKRRATITNAMFCGFPLGAALGGFLASWMIPQWGWRTVLGVGGIAPLLLLIPIALYLPESVRYLVAMNKGADKIRAILSKISASAQQASAFTLSEMSAANETSGGLKLALSRRFAAGTVMLWLTYFLGLVIFYSLINWMPDLLKDAGLTPKSAGLISALFPLGGVGAIALGLLMDRFNANVVIAIGYLITAVLLVMIGQSVGQLVTLSAAVFLCGIFMNAAQSSMPSLAVGFYPTKARVTGVAWMLGVGRFGAIVSPYFIAELTRRNFAFDEIFMVLAVVSVLAFLALIVKQMSFKVKNGL